MIRTGKGLLIAAAAVTAGLASAAHPPAWTTAREPFKIYGNTYYVGTEGLASLLIASPEGHVLIDAGVAEAATLVAANIAKLGFDVTDVKAIVASHAHHDHVGGIAELARLSGATVYARGAQAPTLLAGALPRDDPQHGVPDGGFPGVHDVSIIADDGVVAVGFAKLRAVATPGHTPGGTSWIWQSCEADKCLSMVYGDSLTAVSDDGFQFTRSENPRLLDDFEAGIARLEAASCDVLITPHPGQSRFFERMHRSGEGSREVVTDADGCKRYAEEARRGLAARVERERQGVER